MGGLVSPTTDAGGAVGVTSTGPFGGQPLGQQLQGQQLDRLDPFGLTLDEWLVIFAAWNALLLTLWAFVEVL